MLTIKNNIYKKNDISYMGKLRSNTTHSQFNIFNNKKNPKKSK